MARFSLPEDTRVGAPVYRLRGLDPEGSDVHYSISGEQLTVDRKSGIVSLLRPLDRESVDMVEVIISITGLSNSNNSNVYRGADKSLARPTSRCILFDGEKFRLMLVLLYI